MAPRNKRQRSSLEQKTQPSSSSSSSSSSAADNLSSLSRKPCLSVFPPGYKFVPSDEELISCYLKPYLDDNNISWLNVPIHHMNIYKSNPEQLSVEFEKGNETEWFFISERNKVAKGGRNQKRGDNGGYWHGTVAAKTIYAGQGIVGKKTALSYYVGKQPDGIKTKWLMHEYWFESSSDDEKDYALCKIYVSPQVLKKEKAEKEKNEKLKKEEEKEEVEQLDLHQPDQSQLQDIVYQQQQQYCLLSAQDQEPNQLPHSEVVSFEQEPVIPENFEDFLDEDEDQEFISLEQLTAILDKLNEESNNSCLLEGVAIAST